MTIPPHLRPDEIIIKRMRALRPGESLVYHVGFLDGDRMAGDGSVYRIAKAALEFSSMGIIHLTQQRLGTPKTGEGYIDWKLGIGGGFKYIATGAKPKVSKTQKLLEAST